MVEELIDIRGPLLELTVLADVVKCVSMRGSDFEVVDFEIAKGPEAPSWIRLRIMANNDNTLQTCLDDITRLGAQVVDAQDASVVRVDVDGILPAEAYALTGRPTEVRIKGKWLPVEAPVPNSLIRLGRGQQSVGSVAIERVRKGDRIVVRREGVRVSPAPPDHDSELFGLMGTAVTVGNPRGPAILRIAKEIQRVRGAGGRIALVTGPTCVHTGAAGYVEQIVQGGHIDVLIASNGLAVYDAENALYGTSRGVYVSQNMPAPHGAQNTVHALNVVREAGGLREAVDSKALTSGIMHACITKEVPLLLVGSVRDDASLPDSVTDTTEAREELRQRLDGVGLAIMIAEASLAKAALQSLPGGVAKIYVDISDYDVNKLVTRGSPMVLGLVESAESFLRELARNLGAW